MLLGAGDYGPIAVRSPLNYPEMTAFPMQSTSENDTIGKLGILASQNGAGPGLAPGPT